MEAYRYAGASLRKKRHKKFILYGAFFTSTLGCIGVCYALLYADFLKVKSFTVRGNSQLGEESVLRIVKNAALSRALPRFLGVDNILSWRNEEFAFESSPIARATLSPDLIKRTIAVEVKEREHFAVWCGLPAGDNDRECYWFDREGVAFEKAPATEGSLIMSVHDVERASIAAGAKIAADRFVPNIAAALSALKNLGMNIKEIRYKKSLDELEIVSYKNQWPRILLSIRFDPSANLRSLMSLVENSELKKAQYVDLRVENKIFYR